MELEINANTKTEDTKVSVETDPILLVEDEKQGEEEPKSLSPSSTGNCSRISLDSEGIRQLKKQQTETVVAEPVTETVSTVYMSGSKPGEFTTSLITISVESRRKREIQPSSPALVQMSAVYHGDSSDNDDKYLEVDIEGSIE